MFWPLRRSAYKSPPVGKLWVRTQYQGHVPHPSQKKVLLAKNKKISKYVFCMFLQILQTDRLEGCHCKNCAPKKSWCPSSTLCWKSLLCAPLSYTGLYVRVMTSNHRSVTYIKCHQGYEFGMLRVKKVQIWHLYNWFGQRKYHDLYQMMGMLSICRWITHLLVVASISYAFYKNNIKKYWCFTRLSNSKGGNFAFGIF